MGMVKVKGKGAEKPYHKLIFKKKKKGEEWRKSQLPILPKYKAKHTCPISIHIRSNQPNAEQQIKNTENKIKGRVRSCSIFCTLAYL